MNSKIDLNMSRRSFLKLTGAATLAAAGAGTLPGSQKAAAAVNPGDFESKYGVCDMCFNKCSLIARVRDDVVEKLDPNPKFHKSRGMLCAGETRESGNSMILIGSRRRSCGRAHGARENGSV